jgi:hypothetical protein
MLGTAVDPRLNRPVMGLHGCRQGLFRNAVGFLFERIVDRADRQLSLHDRSARH